MLKQESQYNIDIRLYRYAHASEPAPWVCREAQSMDALTDTTEDMRQGLTSGFDISLHKKHGRLLAPVLLSQTYHSAQNVLNHSNHPIQPNTDTKNPGAKNADASSLRGYLYSHGNKPPCGRRLIQPAIQSII